MKAVNIFSKRSGIVGIGSLLAIAVPLVARQQSRTSAEDVQKRYRDCYVLAINQVERHECAQEAQHSQEYAPWWYKLLAFPEGVTAWAVIITGGLICWQAVETRRAADASVQSISYLIAKEKAYLSVAPRPDSYAFLRPGFVPDAPEGRVRTQSEGTFELLIANTGGSSARGVEITSDLRITDEAGKNLFSDGDLQIIESLSPGGISTIHQMKVAGGVPRDILDSVRRGDAIVHLIGTVRARDAFRPQGFATVWNYVWRLDTQWYENVAIRNFTEDYTGWVGSSGELEEQGSHYRGKPN